MAGHFSFEDVKNIDQHKKDIVFGYVKRVQKLFPNENAYYIIPSLVCYLILLHYAPMEYFDPDLCNTKFILSNNNTIAEQRGKHEQVALLHNVVKSGIHKWTFKLIQFGGPRFVSLLGVFKAKYTPVLTVQFFYPCYNDKVYAYDICSGRKLNHMRIMRYGIRCKQGDVVVMILDLNKLELKYKVNDIDYGVAYKDVEQTSYRAGISGYGAYPTYQLLSYNRIKKE